MNIKVGKTYRDRGGRKVRIVATGLANTRYSVVGISSGETGEETPLTYTEDGIFYRPDVKHPYDIISEWREPVKVSGWVNVCNLCNMRRTIFPTREEANQYATTDRIACVYVEGMEEM